MPRFHNSLADIWADIVCVERGKSFSSVYVTFRTEGEAQDQAKAIRQTPAHNLVPEYMGKRNIRLTVRGISNDVDTWLVVTFVIQYGRVVSAEVTRNVVGRGQHGHASPYDRSGTQEHSGSVPCCGRGDEAIKTDGTGQKSSLLYLWQQGLLESFLP